MPVISALQIDSVTQLATEIWREYYPGIIGTEQVEYMLREIQSQIAITRQINEQGTQYFLICTTDTPVGYLAVQPHEQRLWLSKLYVTARNRKQGYARAAVEFASDLARQFGKSKLALTVNRYNLPAIATYEHLGFRKTGEVVADIGGGFVMDDFQMEKPV